MTIHAWTYHSSEDLTLAGYRCRGPIQCPVCGDGIVIYQKMLNGKTGLMPVFLDPVTFQPHLADPRHAERWHPPVDGKTAATGDRDR